MRLFIAVELPHEIKEELKRLQAVIKRDYAKIVYVKKCAMHLTLKFLGEIKDDRIPKLKHALEAVDFESFEARLEGIGVFPDEDYIKVVWAGVEPRDKIRALQNSIEKSLQGLGFKQEKDFLPHITFCRVKNVEDKDGLADNIKKMEVNGKPFAIDKIALIKSTLTGNGPVHEVLEEYKL